VQAGIGDGAATTTSPPGFRSFAGVAGRSAVTNTLTVLCEGPILRVLHYGGVALRLIPNIRYGTEGYPDKVARRLRALNIVTWSGSALILFFGVLRLFDKTTPFTWQLAVVNLTTAPILAALPLLHRFSSAAAPFALTLIVDGFLYFVSARLGTGIGVFFYYSAITALGILFLGTERVGLTVVLGTIATGLIIALHMFVPVNTGIASQDRLFYGYFVVNVVASSAILYGIIYYAVRQFAQAEAMVEREYERSESLLTNILPPHVAGRLKQRANAIIADAYTEASVLFADMAGFTARASDTAPEDLVRFLNGVYTKLDSLVERHGLEKIKTTGDAYMVVSGVPEALQDHAAALAHLALDIQETLDGLVDPKGRAVPVRIGIASGPVVAGVIGTRKFFYDVWGDTVNTASRMESTSEVGKIQVAPATHELLADRFEFQERGVIEVRGKGPMKTWFLIGKISAGSEQYRARNEL
jgi:adenylate cyclase